jgi:hypothetical protein
MKRASSVNASYVVVTFNRNELRTMEIRKMKQEVVAGKGANRRTFLKGVGMTGVGLAGAAMVSGALSGTEQKVQAAAYSDTDILNFALNLEYLEAEFYAVSTYGATLQHLGVISAADVSGPTTGGSRVPNFSASVFAYLATSVRIDEFNHVKLLRSALGTRAAKKPAINLAAKGYGFGNVNDWLKLASQLEDNGLSAYIGAAPLISDKTILATAASIAGTEGQHEGALRTACVMSGIRVPPLDAKDHPPTPSLAFNVDPATGLTPARTFAEVLNIVYAGGRCAGGFFPNGLSGTIVCQS